LIVAVIVVGLSGLAGIGGFLVYSIALELGWLP
jgi:hypothetical protein